MDCMWYKYLKDADKFYTDVTASQFIMHITSMCDVLYVG